MSYHSTIRGQRFTFASLAELLAKANEEKSGDALAGIAARSQRERVAAKRALADVVLSEIVEQPLIAPEQDEVSRLILETHDRQTFRPLASLSLGAFRELLLDDATDGDALAAMRWAITPEIAAAAAKLMSNKDLVLVASKIRNVTRLRNTMGQRGVLGMRLQPNHPADDLGGILLSAVDGLLFGCGDAVIGVNPAIESVDSVASILRALDRLIDACGAPTQHCCLAHITTQLAALDRGAPIDLLFQSLAGTQAANDSFGINLALLGEGREKVLEHHQARDVAWVGQNVMYFETGQGSALSAEAHHGIDQLTLEARAYGVARTFDPLLVNSVVGFIGPEYLFDERQITRAGLEDHFMGKLLGLPMGCDVCYTNHTAADQNSADNLMLLLTAAGCNYFMGVPCADDVMLSYQSTSYHDGAAMRKLFNLRPAPEFAAWLETRGIFRDGQLALNRPTEHPLLEHVQTILKNPCWQNDGKPNMSHARQTALTRQALPEQTEDTGRTAALAALQARTPARLVVGRAGLAYRTTTQLELREDHAVAVDAVQTELDLARDFGQAFLDRTSLFEVRTAANDKLEFLQRPQLGRVLRADARAEIVKRCSPGADLQVVIGDGLSAAAVAAQVPALLPLLAAGARQRGWTYGQPFAVRYCRVGVLNDFGDVLHPAVVVLLIGERPGLATAESLSAYMAFQPKAGDTDAQRNLISNIHARGVAPAAAAERILRLAEQMRSQQTSGVAIKEQLNALPPDRSNTASRIG